MGVKVNQDLFHAPKRCLQDRQDRQYILLDEVQGCQVYFFLYLQNLEAFALPIKFDGIACGGDFF